MFILMLFSGAPASMPLSLPPLPEDAVLAKVAPEQCLWYVSLAGVDKVNPASKNKVEQLLAEDDVQHFMHELAANVKTSFATGAPHNPLGQALGEEGPKLLETFLTRPLAAYVANVDIGPKGPTIRAGLALNLGDNAAATKASLEKIEQIIPHHTNNVEPTGPADATAWHTLPTPPDAPPVQWGIKDKYLVIGIGPGEADALWARTSKSPPAWLSEIRSQLKVERPAIVNYINLKAILGLAQMGIAANPGGINVNQLLDTLGVHNVKYLASVSGLEGSSSSSRTLLALDGAPAGLLALLGGQPLEASSLDPIPADASFAIATRTDPAKLIDAILNVASVMEPEARQEFERSLGQISQMTGVNIKDDLIASLGDSWCMYNSPDDGGFVFTGLTITATIRDKAKLQRASDQLLAFARVMDVRTQQMRTSNGQMPAGPTLAETDCRGQKIAFFNQAEGAKFPFAPAWCITDQQLVFALFPQTIKAYLELQSADAKSGASPNSAAQNKKLSANPEVAAVFSGSSKPTVLSYQDTPNQFKLFYPVLQIVTQVACSQLQQQGLNLNVGMLPNARAIVPHLTPTVATVETTKDGIRLDSHGTLTGGIGTLPLITIPLLLPATFEARQAARGAGSSNNMKQIALASLIFVDAKKSFPPAFSADKNGNPLLSWRVLILPFLEENALFQQFKLDEPWDSPNNKPLIAKMPAVLKAPGSKAADDFKTVYLTVRGDDAAFPGDKGIKLKQITDGTSKTIMFVEAADDKAVIWTKPDDFEPDENNPLAGLIGLRDGGFLAAFCDGSVHKIPQSVDNATLKALFTRAGGEVVNVP
jgi:hypothetical protein